MIQCIVVDDEQHAIDLLTSHISKIPLLNLQFATTSSVAAFQYLQKHKPHLLFADIQMPELNGMQLIKLTNDKTKVIITSAYAEYALEGYEHSVIDYLLKPVLFERFLQAVQKGINHFTQPASDVLTITKSIDDDFIFVKTETRNKIIRVMLQDIEYIEGLGNYVSIYTNSSRIVTLLTIRELEQRLPMPRFARIHHSYLVPVAKITMVEGNQVQIGKQKLPIGDTYKKTFLRLIEGHVVNRK
jgi:two-component system, LytTR family, response regulator